MDTTKLVDFASPYYKNKDIMHNMWHIELVYKWVKRIITIGNYDIDGDCILYATYFHGFIYSHENDIRNWLFNEKIPQEKTKKIIVIANESQRAEVPQTIEGKILHDAHLVEGGKTYIITKCLITGSVRGQSLLETIDYIEKNILDKSTCYLPETTPLIEEANSFAKEFIFDLKKSVL